MGELGEQRPLLGERRAPGSGRAVEADHPPVARGPSGTEEPRRLHAVQRRVQGARADRVAVLGELGGHPSAVQLAFARVVQHVETDCAPKKVAHVAIVIRLMLPALDHCGRIPGETGPMSERGTAAHLEAAELPPLVERAVVAAVRAGFGFSCRPEHGRLLQVLAGGVGSGTIGETGTGAGVGLAWLASAARPGVRLVSIEHDAALVRVARAVFADCPNVEIRHGDWHDLRTRGPFALLALDGGGQGKGEEAPLVPGEWLCDGGVVVLDDFAPGQVWPPSFAGRVDRARLGWLTHPALCASEIRTAPDAAAILATYWSGRDTGRSGPAEASGRGG